MLLLCNMQFVQVLFFVCAPGMSRKYIKLIPTYKQVVPLSLSAMLMAVVHALWNHSAVLPLT